MADRFPATFPSGQGSDLAGVVDEVGPGVTNVAVGDEVIGFVNNRSSHADFVLVESADLIPRPVNVSWSKPEPSSWPELRHTPRCGPSPSTRGILSSFPAPRVG